MEQGSETWKAFRKSRLTASFISNILGMFGNREECIRDAWLEKIGLKEPFKGNELTRWGSTMEKTARGMYQEISGHRVENHGIALMGGHAAEAWMGGSPDGIIKVDHEAEAESLLLKPGQRILVPCSSDGLLEIKCPAGQQRGIPQEALPYNSVPFYYIPQVQCLMEVLDLEWSHLYIWTAKNGSRIFLVLRDERYFLELYNYMAAFWWNHVIPAKSCLAKPDNAEDYKQYSPVALDPTHLIQESQRLAAKAPRLSFNAAGQLII